MFGRYLGDLFYFAVHYIITLIVLQSDIVDVNTIFKDLATMVHEQVLRKKGDYQF